MKFKKFPPSHAGALLGKQLVQGETLNAPVLITAADDRVLLLDKANSSAPRENIRLYGRHRLPSFRTPVTPRELVADILQFRIHAFTTGMFAAGESTPLELEGVQPIGLWRMVRRTDLLMPWFSDIDVEAEANNGLTPSRAHTKIRGGAMVWFTFEEAEAVIAEQVRTAPTNTIALDMQAILTTYIEHHTDLAG